MNKNLWLAVGLSMVVYGGWLTYMAKHQPQEAAPVAETAATVPAIPVAHDSAPAEAPALRGKAESPQLFSWNAAGTPLRFSSKGGALAGCIFRDVSGPVELLPVDASRFFATWPEVDFAPAKSEDGAFALEATHPSGLRLRKEFVWAGPGRMNTLRIIVSNPTRKPVTLEAWKLSLGPGLGSVPSETDNESTMRAVASWQEPPRKSPTVKQIKDGDHRQEWNWVAVDNRYFLASALLSSKDFPVATVSETQLLGKTLPLVELAAAPVELAAGGARTWVIPFYLGPKDYVALRTMGNGLDASVDFGFFGVLGKFTFRVLRALRGVVGNYGLAIILLTVLLQCLMLPMTLKSLRTSMLMQKLQPKIQEIQKKFADDPKRMNVEMMALYKSSGTNPLGGCLPLLAQLPIFWALFTMLRNCWELHGAPFAFWIRDLSAQDPYHILPLVMGGLMFVQQRMNPAAGDPAQQKIFMFMPVMFIFMFWSFPSGLVLYWMVSSLFGLVQQTVYKRYMKA